MLGKTISHYTILERLGAGGMGVVYKARDTSLDRMVALKFIASSSAGDESLRHRLAREAKACAALNHPNISTVYEFVQSDDHSFIVMEFVDGRTLDKVLEERRLPWKDALPLILQILDGLEAAHRIGIVHRDLKAANIMLTSDGRPKIMDFGLAKVAHGSMLTQSGVTLGTAAYMSPEQARGEETGHRSDIYSMGVILYQMLTGRVPFPYEHHLAILYAVVNESPKSPRELEPSIPPALEQIVLKAMAKEPAQRFQSCAEMARSLIEMEGRAAGITSLKRQFQHLFDAVPGGGAETNEVTVASGPKTSRRAKALLLVSAIAVPAIAVIVILSRLGDQEEARAKAKAHTERAMMLIKENNADLAVRELELAIEDEPAFAPAWSNLASISVQRKEFDRAIEQARRGADLDKTNGSILYNLAFVLEEAGRDTEALTWYREAIDKDPGFIEAYCALANLLVKTGKAGDAVQMLLTCDQQHPSSPRRFQLLRNLGRAYLALGELDKAKEALEQSLQLQAEESETLCLLASACDSLGLREESLTRWKQYVEKEKDPARQAGALHRIEQLKTRQR